MIMEYKAHKESIKDASNRQQVQREQAEQNIRSGHHHNEGSGGRGGHHAHGGLKTRAKKSTQKSLFFSFHPE